jgi:hypothetical protein
MVRASARDYLTFILRGAPTDRPARGAKLPAAPHGERPKREISQAVDANHVATWSSGTEGSARPRLEGIDQIAYPARNCGAILRSRITVASILHLEQAHLPPFPVTADEGIVGACHER